VGNAARIGPAGPVTYRFEIATDSLFRSPLVSETVPETPAQTSFVPRVDLPAGSPLQWRASATDTLTGVTSDYSHGSLLPLAPHSGVYTLVLRLADDCPTLF